MVEWPHPPISAVPSSTKTYQGARTDTCKSWRTMQTALSQTYLCYSETGKLQAMGIADFMIFTAVLLVPVHKEIFPTVE